MPDPIQTPPAGTENVEEPTTTTPPANETPAPQEPVTAPDPNPAPQEPDYRTKFSESTRENQILTDRLRQYETRPPLTTDPTESELQGAFPSWNFMTDTEKELARGQFRTSRIAEAAMSAQKEREAREHWDRELEIAIASNTSLEGKERAFKEFANKPTHRGAPVETLVKAFLYEAGTLAPPRRDPQPGLQTGSGGPKEPDKPKTLNTTELKQLRETDYKAYQEYVKTHDIEI